MATGHGQGAAAAASVAASSAPAKAKRETHTLKEAFDGGLVAITATVDASVKNGERVQLRIESKDDEGFRLKIPKGTTSLHVDIPLGDFVFDVAAEQSSELTGDHPAEIVVRQTGKKRAFEGEFKISVYEGNPLFSGSATVGWVK